MASNNNSISTKILSKLILFCLLLATHHYLGRENQNNSDSADRDLGLAGYLLGELIGANSDVNIELNLVIYKDNFERSADCVQSEEDGMVPLAGILIVDSIISGLGT